MALRSKLRMVEQAKLLGASNVGPEEEEVAEVEQKQIILASAALSSAASRPQSSPVVTSGRPFATSFGRGIPSSKPSRSSEFSIALSATAVLTGATAYGTDNGPGRSQVASARSPVQVPLPSGGDTVASASSVLSAPSSIVSSEGNWMRGPEAVGALVLCNCLAYRQAPLATDLVEPLVFSFGFRSPVMQES